MAQEKLNRAQFRAVFQQVSGKRMAQTVRGHGLFQAGTRMRFLTRQPHCGSTDLLVETRAGKQPIS